MKPTGTVAGLLYSILGGGAAGYAISMQAENPITGAYGGMGAGALVYFLNRWVIKANCKKEVTYAIEQAKRNYDIQKEILDLD